MKDNSSQPKGLSRRHGEPDEKLIVLVAAGIVILVILFTLFIQKRLKR
jgi:hypothetical protein